VQTAFAPNFDGVVAYPASNLTYSFATHGLGAKPTYVHVTMQCKVATGGFAVGDEMPLAVDDSSGRNFSVVFDGTVCGFGRAGDAFYVRRDAAAAAQFNATNWEIRVRCWL
jgi:hypothetical protein